VAVGVVAGRRNKGALPYQGDTARPMNSTGFEWFSIEEGVSLDKEWALISVGSRRGETGNRTHSSELVAGGHDPRPPATHLREL
jgi:hypothetical protein